jgi:hypothetical protein
MCIKDKWHKTIERVGGSSTGIAGIAMALAAFYGTGFATHFGDHRICHATLH